MNLPPKFISTIQSTFQEDGHVFLKALPESIAEAAVRWGLTDIQPSPTLSYNFVAFANRGTEPVVLKMGVPNLEFKSEMATLRLFDGNGACRLLDFEEEKYWMLLERLQPGVMLSTWQDDGEATHIAAELMQKIWRPLDAASSLGENQNFIRLSDWFDGLNKLRPYYSGGTGPFPSKLLERVEQSVAEFLGENQKPVLMHGDFHHYNILSSERGWLIIDPKGVIGPACYEVGPLLINPWGEFLKGMDYRQTTKRRIDILHERLGFERERIREWGLAHAILSAWWSVEDHTGENYALAFAKMIAELDLK